MLLVERALIRVEPTHPPVKARSNGRREPYFLCEFTSYVVICIPDTAYVEVRLGEGAKDSGPILGIGSGENAVAADGRQGHSGEPCRQCRAEDLLLLLIS